MDTVFFSGKLFALKNTNQSAGERIFFALVVNIL